MAGRSYLYACKENPNEGKGRVLLSEHIEYKSTGIEQLNKFLAQIDNPHTHQVILDTKERLAEVADEVQHLVLDSSEIFEAEDIPAQQNSLIKEIKTIEQSEEYTQAIASLSPEELENESHKGLLSRFHAIALDDWDEAWFFNPDPEDDEPQPINPKNLPDGVNQLLNSYKDAIEASNLQEIETLICWENVDDNIREVHRANLGLFNPCDGHNPIVHSFKMFPIQDTKAKDDQEATKYSILPLYLIKGEFSYPHKPKMLMEIKENIGKSKKGYQFSVTYW